MTASSPRRSAAAARRLRQHAATTMHRPLPPELQAVADRFRPQGPLADDWPAVRDATLDVLAATGISGAESLRKHLTHLGYFLAWAVDQGHPAHAATVRRELVDEYARVGMPLQHEVARRPASPAP